MKWFKHYTDSLDDPFIQGLMDEFSHLGYVVFFGLIEIIAKENGREVTGKLSISPTYLRRKLRTSRTKLRQVFDFCQTNGRLLVNYSEKNWDFEFPKIAEIKDNYTKDLQGSCKKPSKQKDKEEKDKEEKEVKRKNKPPISPKGELPKWLPLDPWKDFLEMRKRIRAPMTKRAEELAIRELDKLRQSGNDPTAVLNQSVMNSWKGLFALKGADKKGMSQVERNKRTIEEALRDL